MNDLITYPPVDEELLGEVVRRVRSAGSPMKIILFGSHARGDARDDSDLDLLIVEESALPRWERSPIYYGALRSLHPEKDIVVWTPAEIDEWSNVPTHFMTTIVAEGRVLYEG